MLNNRMLKERASLINDLSPTATVILATAQPELPKKASLSAYKCTACHTEFASNAGSKPFCVNCGAEDVDQTEDDAPTPPKDDSELAAVQCMNHKCGTFNIIHASASETMDGVMHCVTCGTVLAYDNPFNDGKDAPANTRPAEGKKGTPADTRPKDGKKGTPADTRPDTEEDEKIGIVRAGDDDDFEEHIEESDEDGDEETQQFDSTLPEEEDVTLVEPLDTDGDSTDVGDSIESAADFDAGDDEDGDEQEACDEVALSLASVVLAKTPRASFDLVSHENAMLAMLNGVHVATLKKEHAGENSDIFFSKSFSRAILEMAATSGPNRTLKHFGFKPVILAFPQKQVNRALVKKQVQAAAEKMQDAEDGLKEDMEQCVSIAAAGLNRNFFNKHENTLRKGFVQALSSAGVRNAERVVAGVFQRYGDEYHRTLFNVASDLMKKSVAVRNELAEAIKDTNPAADTSQQQDVDNDDEMLESRVQSSVVPKSEKPRTETASVSSIHSLRQAMGGRLF